MSDINECQDLDDKRALFRKDSFIDSPPAALESVGNREEWSRTSTRMGCHVRDERSARRKGLQPWLLGRIFSDTIARNLRTFFRVANTEKHGMDHDQRAENSATRKPLQMDVEDQVQKRHRIPCAYVAARKSLGTDGWAGRPAERTRQVRPSRAVEKGRTIARCVPSLRK